jgi:cytochrome c oxidase assembly protein subunit 15
MTSTLIKQGIPIIFNHKYKPIATWLLGTSTLVATIVHVGGVTRLTRSGLSMVEWKPLGNLPPLTVAEWKEEFNRYKQFPEWQQRKSMTLQEFQYIYYWEWGHRMLGRAAGVCFVVPLAYFSMRKAIPPGYQARFLTLLCMGGTQGAIGWWMVKSGLGEDRRGDKGEIRVSPYRLATHLGMAFTTYSLLLWTGLDVASWPNTNRSGMVAQTLVTRLREALAENKTMMKAARKLRGGSIIVTGLTGLTVISGAFVAGNDAGNAYNIFPKMATDGRWIPWEDLIDDNLQPMYRNLFENTATVQLQHRILGVVTATAAATLASIGLLHPLARQVVTPQVKHGLIAVGGIALTQMSLGITTLLYYVPIGLAAAHQLGSLALLSSGIYLIHSFRYVPRPALLRGVRKVASTAAS